MNVSSLNLCAQPKPLQLESGSNEQLHSAYKSCMVLKKLWTFWRKPIGMLSCLVIMLIFPFALFSDSMLIPAVPSSGARHQHRAAPGTVTVTQRVTQCFSQHSPDGATWIFPKAQTARWATAPPHVLSPGCIQGSIYKRYKPSFWVLHLGCS